PSLLRSWPGDDQCNVPQLFRRLSVRISLLWPTTLVIGLPAELAYQVGMLTAAKLAGHFAAHAIWCVSDLEGEPFIPMLAYTKPGGTPTMIRLVSEDLNESVELGRQQLESNEMDADDGVLLFDGRITLNGEKVDAV